jgi:hypothetical protein
MERSRRVVLSVGLSAAALLPRLDGGQADLQKAITRTSHRRSAPSRVPPHFDSSFRLSMSVPRGTETHSSRTVRRTTHNNKSPLDLLTRRASVWTLG